jgi:hypothetical protein
VLNYREEEEEEEEEETTETPYYNIFISFWTGRRYIIIK